jgi:hypothetical protein
MNENRKSLFRELLYWGMVEIRLATSQQGFVVNPLEFLQRRKRIQFAHEIAEWLHNLAQFSSLDFERFDEGRFWEDYAVFRGKYPSSKNQSLFDRTIKELQTSI